MKIKGLVVCSSDVCEGVKGITDQELSAVHLRSVCVWNTYISAQHWLDAECWATLMQRLCYGLFPVWSLLLCGVTNGNAKIRTGVFKCKEVGRIMTFLFSCLAIHTEAFLFLCHSGWHIINSCLICCLRALLPMQEALNPYTAVRDKTPVGPLPPCFNNKTEESCKRQSISGFLFHSTPLLQCARVSL